MPCLRCGASLVESARFCSQCGLPVHATGQHSAQAVLKIKHLSHKDWTRIAEAFRATHRRNCLIPWTSWMTFNTAWDNYFLGYDEGFEAGVNRALGLSQVDLDYIDFVTEGSNLDLD